MPEPDMNRRLTIYVLLLSALGLATGCARAPSSEVLSPSEPHQRLIEILREENNLEVTTREFEHTMWIYLPLEESFFEMTAKRQRSHGPVDAKTAPAIHFLEGEFRHPSFEIQYDIGPLKTYAKDPGYESKFSQDYQTKQRNILTAISRAYTGAGDSQIDEEKAPDLFMIVMADIVNGLEARTLLHLNDLKRAYTDQTFHGEYAKRVVSEQPAGNAAIIGDQEGEYIDFKDITLPEFLIRQIIFRVNFKYTRSAFPPSGTAEEEILRAAADTVDAYGFTDFTSVILHNLDDESVQHIAQEKLTAHKSEESKGRLIHIKFR